MKLNWIWSKSQGLRSRLFAGLWTLANSFLSVPKRNAKPVKAQTKIEVKEIRLRPKTNEHHRSFKMRDARKWLLEGIKVRVTVRFRGREITYPELAMEDLKEISDALADVATIEQAPMMEGRTMLMILARQNRQKETGSRSGTCQIIVMT